MHLLEAKIARTLRYFLTSLRELKIGLNAFATIKGDLTTKYKILKHIIRKEIF
ncbi:19246_t:CDS:2 [Cetraspora pellucida]|uniref:19246_t:CDS:1 n=1 Tax=Cetraspora pellucida TaxID=1433469 RepID=A0A9N9HGC2_9GLOM|nr:19246_t:CDS:2 [Cetraspora pellucida]